MLFDLTLGRASQYWPLAVAIIDGERSVTFGELNLRVCRLAALLHHKGFRAGDRVAFLLPNCLEFLEVLFTCLRLGLIAVPLNTRLTVSELDAILEDSGARGVVGHRDLPQPNYRAEWQVTVGEEPLEGTDGDLPAAPFDPELVLGLFYTSGTTGVAKGVMLTHANWQATVPHFSQFIRMDRHEVWLHAAPMFHVADFPLILSAVQAGARQVTLPRFEPASFCKAVEQHAVTQTLLIPTMLNFVTLHSELAA